MKLRNSNIPPYLHAHCQSPTSRPAIQSFDKELAKPTQEKRNFKKCPTARQSTMKTTATNIPTNHGRQGSTGGNSVLPQLAVTCKIEAECSYQTFVQVDSEVLRNRQLRQHAKRYLQTHMKYILFISVVILTSCFNSNYEKFSLDKSKIDFIEIRKRVDTVSIRLSENQIDSLIAKLENSEPKQPLYIFAEYYLKIHFINMFFESIYIVHF